MPGPCYHGGDAGRRGPKDLTFSVDSSGSGSKCNGQRGDDPLRSTATHLAMVCWRWHFPTALPPDKLLCWAFREQLHKEISRLFWCGALPSSKCARCCLIEHCGAEQHSLDPAPNSSAGLLGNHFSPPAFAALLVEKTLMSFLFKHSEFYQGKALKWHLHPPFISLASFISLLFRFLCVPFSLPTNLPTYPPIEAV